VDSNVGFAGMLQQSLEQRGAYRVTVAYDGARALEAASEETFDLAIVDLGVDVVDDLDGATVARRLRQGQPDLRLMLIPLVGDTLSEEMADLDVQGTLPKPFFLPDLPDLLEAAMARPFAPPEVPLEKPAPVEAPALAGVPAPPPVAVPLRAPYECPPRVMRELENLAREINAAAVLLSQGEEVLGAVGNLRYGEMEELARIVAESARISTQVAEILGREQGHFEQSMEGDEQILYSLTVAEDAILSAVLRDGVALGMLRHHVRSTARRLRDLIS
jgi:CheY-like chemotaxis protein